MPKFSSPLVRCFVSLPDPRQDINKQHFLSDIVAITLAGVIAGFEAWDDIALFAQHHEDWFRKFLRLPNGIPSHDTLRRVFLMLDPKAFSKCFTLWMREIQINSGNKVYAVDGKTLRRSFDNASGKAAIHMVSAWCVENGVSIGQVAVDEKSNEITAIPELLKFLEMKGALITIDAMGCQTAIAGDIVRRKGEYMLAVKGNQPDLHDQLKDFFAEAERSNFDGIVFESSRDTDGGHGRIEKRDCYVVQDLDWLEGKERWADLSKVVMVKATRKEKGKETLERRYYISNTTRETADIGNIIRSHWSIENSLHYVLDMTFFEDQSRKRKDNSAINFGLIRRAALSLLKQRGEGKGSMRWKRALAAMDLNFLEKVLGGA